MRKCFFYTVMVLLFLINCSETLFAQSAKDRFDSLNEYLETVEKDSTKRIIVTKEKISANMTLKILKVNEIQSIDFNGNIKGDETMYSEKDWRIMKKKYENTNLVEKGGSLEDKYWSKKDFRNNEIVFEGIKGRSWDVVFKKYYDNPKSYLINVYSFSDPIYYKKNNFIVFTVFKNGVVGGAGGSAYIVIMQKRKGKWVQTHIGYPDWHS